VPYRQVTFDALNSVAKRYITTRTTYLDAVDDAVSEPAAAFLAVERVLIRLNQIWMCLMQILIGRGFAMKDVPAKATSPNGFRSRKAGKQALLNWAVAMFEIAPNALEICNQYGFFGVSRGSRL